MSRSNKITFIVGLVIAAAAVQWVIIELAYLAGQSSVYAAYGVRLERESK